MRELSLDGPDGRLRARRWDVLMLGGAIPGLVAAVRLGMAGARVLVVGSENSSNTQALVRVANAKGTPSHRVDGPHAVDPAWLSGAATVLV